MVVSDHRLLGERTWPEVAGRDDLVLVVPTGSTEQHGPHLPLDTDTRIAVALADALAASDDRLVVSPPIAVGASGEHAGFAGTLSIGTEVMRSVVVELVRSADHFSGVVLVHAHGGNRAALDAATEQLATEGRRVLVVRAGLPGGDAHAGRTETSLLLHLAPDVVRLDRAAAGETRPWRELDHVITGQGVIAVSPNGVLGDPEGANAKEGATLFAAMCDRARDDVARWRRAW